MLTLAAVASFLFATPPATADERPLHLAMHDMMPMQSNGQSGGSGGSMGGGGHLSARLEALKSARTAFAKLHGTLDETQKRTADELVAPFVATF